MQSFVFMSTSPPAKAFLWGSLVARLSILYCKYPLKKTSLYVLVKRLLPNELINEFVYISVSNEVHMYLNKHINIKMLVLLLK